ncbi:MAG: TetR/AcrR family transcriptional regulator [Pleurocapsa minor GSE-CHR-MK-17-07R]|jgi:TetR/AcrR family fatty acid metabolism transcriptional regulator|nr:TetR/AcrR family transcriptional regulator [Pleurocapsa minor GSE-CHR-MK 17-07R]
MTDLIQQQLIAARRNQILDAAAVVFAEHGFHPTTIRDIARHAGIADGTIYNYFDNKTALLLGIFERAKASIVQQHMPAAPEQLDLRTLIKLSLVHPLMALKQDNFALFRILLSEMMVNEDLRTLYFQQIMEPMLSSGELMLGQASVSYGLTPREAGLTVRAISALMLGMMLHHIMGDTTLHAEWDAMPDFLTDLILNGILEKNS